MFSHLFELSSDKYEGREFGTRGGIKTREYIVNQLVKAGIPAFSSRYEHDFTKETWLTNKQGSNIIAWHKGEVFPNQFIVLTAHFDHLGIKGRRIFNGADDNASGTALLLTIAQQLVDQQLKYSVIFLFTDGEEKNLLGSKAFLTDYHHLIPSFKLNINLDMLAGDKRTKELHFIDRKFDLLLSQQTLSEFRRLQSNSSVIITNGFTKNSINSVLRLKNQWRDASDHGAFNRKNIPFIYYGVGEHKNYHTENDNYENVNLGFYLAASTDIYQQMMFLDQNL